MSAPQHSERPARVLHFVGLRSRGGIDACLLNLLRTLAPERCQTVVAWRYGDGGELLDELRALGVAAAILAIIGHLTRARPKRSASRTPGSCCRR